MLAQKNMLLRALEDHGWRRVSVDEEGSDWWADEQWCVSSTHEGSELQLVLTFLVNPMWDGPRKSGEHVWAIGAAASQPRDRISAGSIATAQIRNNFAQHLRELIQRLDDHRRASKADRLR